MSSLDKVLDDLKKDFENWVNLRHFQLAVFNIILISLALLRSAGYFEPFFLITINIIVLISLVMLILLLKTSSKFLFSVAICFWAFAGLLKLFQVSVWAERTTIYAYEAILIGIVQLVIEVIHRKEKLQASESIKSGK
ncbi:MAG: hypothetical protein Q7R49_04330 [Candidatus Daviesbacteria bacterium]|nr:hypothetical protein [Candidatus Daviesbacteria bacterium]